MRTDAVIKQEGFRALSTMLDLSEADRFITLIKQDNLTIQNGENSVGGDESEISLSGIAEIVELAWASANPKTMLLVISPFLF
ncbi:MAG: hypothetical protein IPM69_12035 [Ignavibacteria bacterium]|nr:hypothetical protein [Ignavibacteria bacterium]